jgi:hypothetical protein
MKADSTLLKLGASAVLQERLATDLKAAWEIVDLATPLGWSVGRPIFFGNERWAVWAVGPTPSLERRLPAQIEGSGASEAGAVVDLATKLRRIARHAGAEA